MEAIRRKYQKRDPCWEGNNHGGWRKDEERREPGKSIVGAEKGGEK